MKEPVKKIDIHLHLSLNQIPKNDKIFISSAKNMIPHLKELGIEKGILMSMGENTIPFGSNEECIKIVQTIPNFYFWTCNLDDIDEDTVYNRLQKYKLQGAVGIGEFVINKKIDDPFIQKVFDVAQDLDMPILFHMSPQVGYQYGIVDESGLPLLEESLKKYPKLKFIGHSQPFWHEITKDAKTDINERMKWGEGKVISGGRLPYLFENYSNLYGDLSANSGGCAIMRDEDFGLDFLQKYNDRLMFGSDMVNVEMEFPLGKWLDKMYLCDKLDKDTYENICYKNAQRVFKL